jgi:hypothetical protein
MTDGKRMKLGEYLIGKGFEFGGKALGEALRKASDEEIRATIDRLQTLADSIDETGDKVQYDEAKKMLWQTAHDLRSRLAEAKEAHTKGEIDTLVNIFTKIFEVFRPLLTWFWATIYGVLLNLIGPEKDMTYEKAKKRIENFLTIQGDLNVIAALIQSVETIQIFGTTIKTRWIAQLITNLSWTFGFGWLSWVALSPTLQAGMSDPLQRYYRRLARTGLPTRADYEDMERKMIIDTEGLKERYRDEGYPDDIIEKMVEANRKYPTESDLKVLYYRGKTHEEEVKLWLQKLGYRGPTLDVEWDSFVAEQERSWFNKFIDEMIRDYIDGYTDEAGLRNDLAYQGIPPHIIEWIVYVAKRRAERELKDDYVKTERTNFREKKISIEELQSRLTQWIKRPEVIQSIVDYEQSRLKPEQEPSITAKRDEKLKKLQFRRDAITKRIEYLNKIKEDTRDYYDYKIYQLQLQLAKAKPEDQEKIKAAMAALMAQQDKAIASIDSQIEQLQIKLAEVNADIEALQAGG